MILQSLHELYGRLADDSSYEIAPPGSSPQKISFEVILNCDGSFDVHDYRKPDAKGKLQNDIVLVPGEAKPSGSGINPCFLWDNQTYLLGRQPVDKADGFGASRFEAFRDKHLVLEKEIGDESFSAVCRFLREWKPERIAEFPILDELLTGFGIFRLQGEKRPVHEAPAVQAWWRKTLSQEEPGTSAQCLISGAVGPVARLHPKIKGVTGAQSSGASLVSFNASAYESYGKEQSYNSPVGEDAAFRYGTALNSLLTGPKSSKHRIRIGDTTTVFWTEKPTAMEDCFAGLISSGSQAVEEAQDEIQRERITRLLEAVRSGGHFQEFGDPDTPFFILGLAPNAARLSVRFFHRSTVGELLTKLHDHHRCMEMVRQFTTASGKGFPDPEFPAVWQILRETARVVDEIPPLLGGGLLRSIVEGTPYAEGLFSSVIRRIHADRTIGYLRASILKAILVRNHRQSFPVMLDPANNEPAYLLGRLFAALEKTQEDALGNLNAGLRDRFYSAASATPASVFPRILRTYGHHLGKLQTGARITREKLIQDIVGPISSFPNQLNLRSQGVFAIGYYHQRKAFFTKKDNGNGASE
ncbi:type I-C CRISPR-associated protein Cas8c/Csd1 [Luteolibacter luteus]|uniref:Type I-C CRISPR-associated protein Cas8c/Csd1 n=1 Tax=Luteolibacter luteus TaxID=2728835 RepID=A0A858RGS7_9BACT|nr:type I-C CRISPR-associated protein Cas8c/Csd1 [Luteolibacter luteus]QJE95728.1 type I-C CRISPR-associated protein Cas8c/Csd1 [Luteolibacter luteus]